MFEQKQLQQEAHAVAKYGEVALLPGGVPEYDVLDYAINEIAGLPRYLQMVTHRVEAAGLLTPTRQMLLQMIHQQVRIWGEHLIGLQQDLADAGVVLGTPEVVTTAATA